MTLDLEDLAGRESYEIPGFNERLLRLLPGLQEHHCGLGRRGGFVERLKGGTWFGHIVEHVALELTDAVGISVNRGKTVSGDIPTLVEVRHMEDEAIIERLTSVRGIGRWTVEMLLIFGLGRPDVLPADDYGIRKGFARTYTQGELPARKDVETYGFRWKPYRTVASWYLWRVAEQAPLQRSQ